MLDSNLSLPSSNDAHISQDKAAFNNFGLELHTIIEQFGGYIAAFNKEEKTRHLV
jgi:hypothetical protein